MEYLMSYGWAILVIMMVGGALWRLGLFSPASSAPPTSSGFEGFSPLLVSCKMGNRILDWGGEWYYSGFACQFVNDWNNPLIFRSVNMKVNGKYCNWYSIASNLDPNAEVWMWEHECDSDTSCPVNWVAWYYTGSGDGTNDPYYCGSGQSNCLSVPAGYQLHIRTISPNPHMYEPIGDCYPTEGKYYDVDIDIEYDMSTGGVVTRKHSTGKIHILGEP
jgi:hypothetical protein